MSDLYAVAYDDRETAERIRWELVQLSLERVVALDDAVVVTRAPDGRLRRRQSLNRGGAGSGRWGSLIGAILLGPLLDERFMDELAASLPADGAALIVLVRSRTPEKVVPHMSRSGGKLIRTSLGSEAEARLDAALTPSA